MNKVTITINCENDAFQDDAEYEVIRILQDVINDLRSKSLRDINGNTCGNVEIE